MSKRPKIKQLGADAIPTASLADMTFILLFFFIITTTLTKITGFTSEMPAGEQGQSQEKSTAVTLNDDTILLNDQPVTIEQLYSRLKALRFDLKSGDGKIVIITATGMVGYQNYYAAMAAIQMNGGVVVLESEGKKQ